MAGAGNIILFVVSFVGFVLWSGIYLMFAGHYFLTTLIDSSAGHDEVNYGHEGFFERWWKPIFCLWILAFWVLMGGMLVVPLAAWRIEAVAVGYAVLLWIVFPVSLLSALVANHWFYFLYPPILPRLARKFGPWLYVSLMTLLTTGFAGGLLFAAMERNLLWAIPAAFVIPTALFLYARHWGRFAWLALNFGPRKKKRRREKEAREPKAPEMEVEEVDTASEGVRAGLPPAYPHGIQAATANRQSEEIKAGPPAAPSAVEEEFEDEWSLNKKPYFVTDPTVPETAERAPAYATETVSDADKPFSASEYHDRRIDEERRREREKKKTLPFMQPASRKAPSFQTALLRGVWLFMIYPSTIQVWAHLVLLTSVELFFLSMMRLFFPG